MPIGLHLLAQVWNKILVKMVALKVMTLNTGNNRHLGGLLAIIRLENPDIVLLQEITVTSGQLKLFVAKHGYSAEANTDLLDVTSLGHDLEITSSSQKCHQCCSVQVTTCQYWTI